MRAPEDEEPWRGDVHRALGTAACDAGLGRPPLVLAALTGSVTGVLVGAGGLLAGVFAALCLVGGVLCRWGSHGVQGDGRKPLRRFSGGWTLALYLGLGLSAPLELSRFFPLDHQATRSMKYIFFPQDEAGRDRLGGKAAALQALHTSALPIPSWFVLSPQACLDSLTLEQKASLARGNSVSAFDALSPTRTSGTN